MVSISNDLGTTQYQYQTFKILLRVLTDDGVVRFLTLFLDTTARANSSIVNVHSDFNYFFLDTIGSFS